MQEGGQVTAQLHRHLPPTLPGEDQYRVNQTAQRLGRRRCRGGIGQGGLKRLDLAAVQPRQVGVQCWDRFRRAGGSDLGGQCRLLTLHLAQLPHHGRAAMPVLEQIQQVPQLATQLGLLPAQLGLPGAALSIGSIDLSDEGPDEFLDQLRRQETLLEAGHHPAQQDVPQQGAAVVAGAALDMVGAAQAAIAPNHAQRPIALATAHQSREQPRRPPCRRQAGTEVAAGGKVSTWYRNRHDAPPGLEPRLRRRPEVRRNDGEIRDLGGHPGLARVRPGDPLAGIRVLDEALPVPDPLTDVEPVAQQSGLSGGATEQQAGSPLPAPRARNRLAVQRPGDGSGRLSCGIGQKNALHDRRLGRGNLQAAGDRQAVGSQAADNPVTETQAATAMAGADPTLQATVGLLRQILQEQRRHRPLEADVQLRDIALGDSDDPHPGEADLLMKAGDVFLVAADPVQRLGGDDLKATGPGISHQLHEAGPAGTRAADGVVGVNIHHRPALALGPYPANPHLVLDRGLSLAVRAVAGINGAAHQSASSALVVA